MIKYNSFYINLYFHSNCKIVLENKSKFGSFIGSKNNKNKNKAEIIIRQTTVTSDF